MCQMRENTNLFMFAATQKESFVGYSMTEQKAHLGS